MNEIRPYHNLQFQIVTVVDPLIVFAEREMYEVHLVARASFRLTSYAKKKQTHIIPGKVMLKVNNLHAVSFVIGILQPFEEAWKNTLRREMFKPP